MQVDYREEPCRSVLNPVRGMAFRWSLNPYMGCAHRCTFCYVRAYEQRADRPSDDRYGRSVRVKINAPEVLRRELSRPSWRRELVSVGAATDPYQPVEGKYRLTRRCLDALAAARTPFSIITRGPMVIRDIDVLQHAARRAEVDVNVSIGTLDETIRRKTEPGTAPPRQRLRAVSALASAGIRAAVGIAPILPGITDRPEQLAEIVRAARDAGAAHVWCNTLFLRSGTREHFLEHLARDWPELLPHYARLYRGAYLAADDARPLIERVAVLRDQLGVADRREVKLEPPAQPVQLSLAV
jgi:DNA repair photolyase